MVRTEGSSFRYIGSTANSFKKRLANHLHSFRNPGMKNSTSLARTIHDLKNRKIEYTIDWKVIKRARAYSGGGGECGLCIEEVFTILQRKDNLINRHTECLINCLHKRKMCFNNYKSFKIN